MASAIYQSFVKHPHWRSVASVVAALKATGHQALIAGGAVRDALLGREIHDFDVATSADPEEVERIFSETVPIGKAFGIIMVKVGGISVEVATFRKDLGYQDGRRPVAVRFSDAREDALRRDFTINGLFYDLTADQVIDFVQGQEDLKRRLVRTIGLATERFQEDHLRILRAIRFAAQLDFEIDQDTWQAVVNQQGLVQTVAKERATAEIKKMTASRCQKKGWALLAKTQLLQHLRAPQKIQSVLEQEFAKERVVWPEGDLDLPSIWAWLHFLGGLTEVNDSMFVFSRQEQNQCRSMVRALQHLDGAPVRPMTALRWLDEEWGLSFLKLWQARCHRLGRGQEDLERARQLFQKVMTKDGHLPKPMITGKDLAQIGSQPSPRWAEWLEQLYELQIVQQLGQEDLLQAAREMVDKP